MYDSSRAAELRARAAAFGDKAKLLAADDQRALLLQQRALLQLAEMEKWIAKPAHVQAKHDYCLEPKAPVPVKRPKGKPGRKPNPKAD